MTLSLPLVYPITDTRISGLSHVDQVRELIAGGAKFIQLRDKRAGADEFYQQAREVMSLAREHDAKIIINDRVDIALAVGAHGVHLGQDDLPVAEVRRLLGDDSIIGLSTHNKEQLLSAKVQPVDYIAIGPIFQTATKEDPDPVVGLDGLAAVRDIISDVQLVAIGGINSTNISDVIRAGADSAAVIGAVLRPAQAIANNYRALTSAAVG